MKKDIVTMLVCIKIIFFLPNFLENNGAAKDCVTLLDLLLILHGNRNTCTCILTDGRDMRYITYWIYIFIPHQMHSPVVLGGSNSILVGWLYMIVAISAE